jgi:hypothetical protein
VKGRGGRTLQSLGKGKMILREVLPVRYKFIRMNILYNPPGVVGIYFVVYTRARAQDHGCEGVRNNERVVCGDFHASCEDDALFRGAKKQSFKSRIYNSVENAIEAW